MTSATINTTSKAIRFNEYDSTAGSSHSYSGSTSGYDLAYNGRRYQVRMGHEMLYRPADAEDCGAFDPVNIAGRTKEVDVNRLPPKVQDVLGIADPVPEGHVLVVKWDCGVEAKSWDGYGFNTHDAGDLVAPTQIALGHKYGNLLAEGQEAKFDRCGFGHHARPETCIVKCVGGKAVVEVDKTEAQNFAREQVALLIRECGLSNREARAAMKAGGPGAVAKAVEWLRECQDNGFSEDSIRLVVNGIETHQTWDDDRMDAASRQLLSQGLSSFAPNTSVSRATGLGRDAIDIVFDGVDGVRFGRQRIVDGLVALGLPTPKHYNARSLEMALAIAKAIVATGKFPLLR